MTVETIMLGKRIYPNDEGHLVFSEPGCYGKDRDGLWWCRPPKGGAGVLGDHKVTEHEDGTITVEPSILMPGVWHGYLRKGVWEEA
jgi:hypothetical protein